MRRPAGGIAFVATVAMPVLLPPLVFYMWICLEYNSGALVIPASAADWAWLVARVPAPTWTALAICLGWFAFQAMVQLWVPGPWREGVPLRDGSRLSYRLNGWLAWWITWTVLAAGVLAGWITPTVLADNFGPLMAAMNLAAFVLSVYLYVLGRRRPHPGGELTSGRPFYDYVMGNSLNPRNGRFDWKLFCEARPGLMAWVAIDLSLAAKQYAVHGAVTTPMLLVCAFHVWYVADYYYHEEAILTTWDIKHENFGWMLCWGDLVWVPFTYTIQAYYLVNHTHDLPWWSTLGIVVLNTAGYVIFRATNIQKHRFRRDPGAPVWGKTPQAIRTATGSLLLTSGWWGLARHINYFGDLLMGLAWCLPAGFRHALPYFYVVYFTVLLVHRERRDHAMCAAKYGDDWKVYCDTVPWRIVPGLY
jgi:protein-S-isoprenylcysteine O-methyltransferase Ste14